MNPFEILLYSFGVLGLAYLVSLVFCLIEWLIKNIETISRR